MRILLSFLCIGVVFGLDAFTSISMVRFDENIPKFTLFALDGNGNPGTNSFSVRLYPFYHEIEPFSFNIVATHEASEYSNFSYVSPEETPSIAGGLQYTHAHQVIYTNQSTGAQVILFLFTADQIVIDIASGKHMEVKNGDTKNSYRTSFFPFSSPSTLMEVTVLMETLIPDSMYYCSVSEDPIPGVAEIFCAAEDISGTGVYFTEAVSTDLFNDEKRVIPVDIGFFICPIQEKQFPTQDTGIFCPISLAEVGTYPLFYDFNNTLSECNRDANIRAVEIRMRFSNFQQASLDYDPDFSVLFSGVEGQGECASSEEDYFFAWLSFAFMLLALAFVIFGIIIAEIFFRVRECARDAEHKERTDRLNLMTTLDKEING